MKKAGWAAGLLAIISLLGVAFAKTGDPATPDFKPATVVSSVTPYFPETAINSGTVVVSVHLDEAGQIAGVKIINGSPGFNSAALDAVRKWRFKPATLDGVPVPTTVPVAFSFGWPVACMGGGKPK